MAQVVEKMPERPVNELYQWNEWLDGQVWQLTAGKDFSVMPTTMCSYAYATARARGGRATVKIRGEDVYVQFIK